MPKQWRAEITGNMTLSILDEDGLQILKVDMKSSETMKAETGGERLVCAINDLSVLAFSANGIFNGINCLPYPEATISPTPWSMEADTNKRRIIIRDATRRKIADRTFPCSVGSEQFEEILTRLRKATEEV